MLPLRLVERMILREKRSIRINEITLLSLFNYQNNASNVNCCTYMARVATSCECPVTSPSASNANVCFSSNPSLKYSKKLIKYDERTTNFRLKSDHIYI